MAKSKQCKSCKKRKPIEDFGKQHNTKDGYRHHCRICQGNFRRKKKEQNGLKTKIAKINKAIRSSGKVPIDQETRAPKETVRLQFGSVSITIESNQ